MSNEVTFSFRTEAPWTESELDTLNSELSKVVIDMDDDHIQDSFETVIRDEDDDSTEEQKRQEILASFMKDAVISVNVKLSDPEGNEVLNEILPEV